MLKRTGVFITAMLVFTFISQAAFAAVKVPGRTRFSVNDYANVIDADTKRQLETLLKDFNKRHKQIEIVLTTIPSLEGTKLQTFVHEYAYKWRRIWPMRNESRVHFVVAVKEQRMRLGVSHTLEGILTENVSQKLLDEVILPEFAKQNYSEGIRQGTLKIVEILEPVDIK